MGKTVNPWLMVLLHTLPQTLTLIVVRPSHLTTQFAAMLLSTLLLKTVNAAAADTNRVLLQNAAAPDTWMPLAGLGMGNIGTYGKNAFAAVNVTRTWLEQGCFLPTRQNVCA